MDEASLSRVRVPIGLDLGAKSAPEIALAVLAEIQAVRGGGTGLPMSEKKRGAMKAIAMRRETATADVLVDRVLCHDVRDPGRRVVVAKGARIDADGGGHAALGAVGGDSLLALDPGDVHEEEAGERLAERGGG